MLIECYDKKGAEVYEMIIKQIFQDLVLGPAVDDLRAFINPDEPVFVLVIKMKNASSITKLGDITAISHDKTENSTQIVIDDENYLPNILKLLWSKYAREDIYQPNRYTIVIEGDQTSLADEVINDPHSNLQKRIYDAVFRILPEGFKIIKDLSKGNFISIIATDELIKDAWIEKANLYMEELNE